MNWFACLVCALGHIASGFLSFRCGAGSFSGNELSCGGSVYAILYVYRIRNCM